jgi:hypothetical protein
MLQTYSHQDGNNYQSVKTKRVNVTLTISANNPRYYFPDIPELNDVEIVGIQAHYGDNGLLYGDIHFNVGDPNTPWAILTGVNCFLNLINTKNELIVSNFPLLTFYNPTELDINNVNNILNDNMSGKIIPINSKLLLRQCYIYVNTTLFGTSPDCVATFTFFHLGKK